MFFFKSFPGCKIVETQLVLFQNKNQSKQDTYNSKGMVVLLCFGESLNMFFKVRAKLAKMVKRCQMQIGVGDRSGVGDTPETVMDESTSGAKIIM